jgi:soluble lytic murein transglycosylase-like protein
MSVAAVQPQAVLPQAVLKVAAERAGVDELFVRSVAKVESGLRQEAVSKKGALGLMQLMPGTAAELGVDPLQADQNASGGAKYLRALLEQYRYNPVLALAAYNAGPRAVTRYGGVPPYYETRTYVVRVLKEYDRQLKAAGIKPDGTHRQQAATAVAKKSSATN